ncbi:MAG: OmpA family protein [Rubricoccaceae bacterium]
MLLLTPLAWGQGYLGGDLRPRPDDGILTPPGVRVGLSVGATTYFGPNILYGRLDDQRDVRATRPGVSAHVSFPLGSERLYGRALMGLFNLGADVRADAGPGQNPFLTNPNLLLEGDVLVNLLSYRQHRLVPYAFTGAGALVADPFGRDEVARSLGRARVAYFVPAGLGVDFRLSRSVSVFAEGSYRFGLNNVGALSSAATANIFASGRLDPCQVDPNSPECLEKICDENPNDPRCPDVDPEDEARFSRRFGRSFVSGGIQIGFGRTPRRPAPVVVRDVLPSCRAIDARVNPDGSVTVAGLVNSDATQPVVLTVDFGDGATATALPATHTYARPGAYTVRVTAQNVAGVERCLIPVTIAPARRICDLVELNAASFDFGSAALDPRARVLLEENVQLLRENPECCLFIDGSTDSAEDGRFGPALAGRRAQAVYDYYLSRGVAASRMLVRNRGVAQPPCDKEDPGIGCARSRRVESIPVDCERFRFLLD